MEKVRKIRTLCTDSDWVNAMLFQITLDKGTLKVNTQEYPFGIICAPVIDSREEGFRWTRCWLDGKFSLGTSVRVRCYLSDELDLSENGFSYQLEQLSRRGTKEDLCKLQALYGDVISEETDFLIPGEGRYLWLMIEIGNLKGEDTEISALHIQMEADHMRDYLPAIYREDDFTYRFLSVFDSMVSDLEQRIDTISSELDIHNAGEEMIQYLAGWIGVEPVHSISQMREAIASALSRYEVMYSLDGIKSSVETLTGHTPIILEGGDPGISEAIGISELREMQAYLNNPYVFFVLLPEEVFPTRKSRDEFEMRMEKYIPAGVEMKLITLKNGVTLGNTNYLGINTSLEDYSTAVIDENSVLWHDTMIGG